MEHLAFTIISFLVFTALVGYISAKLVTSDDQHTESGYFLAGKGLSGVFIAGSMILTNISAQNLVGMSGQSYRANMSGMAWEATPVIATIVMAMIFLPVYLRKGYTTLPEFLEDRYDSSIRKIVSLLFLLGYVLFAIPICLYAGAIGFYQIFDLSLIFGIDRGTSMTIMIVALGVVGALYAVFGGLKAVAVSDTINGILLFASGIVVPIFGLAYLGNMHGGSLATGLKQVLNVNPEKLNAIGGATDPVPFSTIFTGMLFANLFYWGTNQVLIQRTLGAKNLKEGQKGVLLSGFIKILLPIILVFPGIIAFHVVPGLEKADFSYPQLVARVLPWPLAGLFFAGLFGAIISTYNSLLNSASTIFMLDIYKPLINPGIQERELIKKAKLFGIAIAVFSISISPMFQTITGIYNFGRATTGFYNMPIITIVLAGMFTKWATPLGAKLAIVFHLVFYILMQYIIKIDTPDNIIGVRISFIHVFAISVGVMFIIIYIAARLRPSEKVFDKNVSRVKNYDMRPWRLAKPVSAWLICFLVYVYLILSPWGLATEQRNMTFILGATVAILALTVLLLGVPLLLKASAETDTIEESEEKLDELAIPEA